MSEELTKSCFPGSMEEVKKKMREWPTYIATQFYKTAVIIKIIVIVIVAHSSTKR